MKTATVMNYKCQHVGLAFIDANDDSDIRLSFPMPPTVQRYFHESPAIIIAHNVISI